MKARILDLPGQLFLPLGLLGAYLALAFVFLQDYLIWDSQWLLALALLPGVARAPGVRSFSPALLLAVLALALPAALLHNTTLYFFAFLTAMWCGARLLYGRVSAFPLLLLAAASPLFKYVAQILSFPLRLALTSRAAAVLDSLGLEAEAAGNLILIRGEEFSVDPACAGLSMLSLSLILAVFVLAHLQHGGRPWPGWLTGGMLAGMLVLNLGANLLRILLLVLFQVLPGNPLHDVLGLLCLLLYALVPFYLLARLVYRRINKQGPAAPNQAAATNRTSATAGTAATGGTAATAATDRPTATNGIAVAEGTAGPSPSTVSLRGRLFFNFLLLLLLAGIGSCLTWKQPPLARKQASPIPGFDSEAMANGVTKYRNGQALVYLKPVPAFYSTEHHPLICWEGSGYKFRNVRQRSFGAYTVFFGELQKKQEKLYTAWWMDNGSHPTIRQWDWRWRMLKGEAGFQLVNVTVARKEDLYLAIDSLVKQGIAGTPGSTKARAAVGPVKLQVGN
ncbi:MAG: archaeosortase/exosortase family protein [Adhaeribacter sp.]